MKNEHRNRAVTQLVLAVLKTNAAVWRAGEAISAEVGLSASRWQVLASLARGGAWLTVPELARDLDLTRQGTQKQVDLLVQQGFVALEDNPQHRRSVRVRLTSSGRRMNDRALRRWARVSTRLLPAKSVTQLRELDGLLRTLTDELDAALG